MSDNEEQQQSTIKDLADSARRRGRDYYGDAAFAGMCMEFDARLPDIHPYGQYLALIRILAVGEYQSARTMQLGCVAGRIRPG
jgi:hypothetical protein